MQGGRGERRAATGRAELRALEERRLGAYRFSKRFAARPLVDGLYVCSGLFENSANSGNIGQIIPAKFWQKSGKI